MKILLPDDHQPVREAIADFIQAKTGHHVEGVADLPAALAAVRCGGVFDLVLLDYQMPGMTGLHGHDQMLILQGVCPVALLSGSMPEALVQQALRSGAAGYLLKTMAPASLVAAIVIILAGGTYAPPALILRAKSDPTYTSLPTMSNRETEVLRCICRGMTNVETARKLGLHEAKIKLHVHALCVKFTALNRTQATIKAREVGFC